MKSERRFQNLIENSSDLIAELDSSGRMLYANRNWNRFLGPTPANSPRDVFQFLPANEIEEFRLAMQNALQGNLKVKRQHRLRNGENEWVLVDSILNPYCSEEERYRLAWCCRICEESAGAGAEATTLREHEMLRILASGVAHQFNNIHTALHGNLELLGMASLNSDSQERLRRAIFCVEKATHVTRRLMAFVRGQAQNAPSRFWLRDLLWEVLQLTSDELEAEGIKIDLVCSASPQVEAERGLLTQVFFELISNSRHALRDAPLKHLRLELREEDGAAVVVVSDSGCGIPPEDQERIFLPFYTTKGEYAVGSSPLATVKGEGLGLSIARQCARQCGGELTCAGQPEAGTTFILRLPLASPPATPPAPKPTRRGARVLVVDDEELLRHSCQLALRFEGHQCRSADNGASALELLRQEEFDVLLLDLNMPRLGGQELLRALGNAKLARKPEVIVMSGLLNSQLVEELKARGVFAVMDKPFRQEALLGFVAQILAVNQQRRRAAACNLVG